MGDKTAAAASVVYNAEPMRQLRRRWKEIDWSWLRSPQIVPLALLATTIIVAPLGYGSVLPGGMLRIELLAFATLLATATTLPLRLPRRAMVPLAALAGLILLGATQIIPAAGLVDAISPASARIYAETNQILALHGERPVATRISLAPSETITSILLTAAYAAAFVSAAALLTTAARRRAFAHLLVVNAFVHVVIAATKTEESDRASGVFVNPNHLAAYLEMALALAFGLLWIAIITARSRGRRGGDRGESLEQKLLPIVRQVILWAAIGGGIALTLSRGGILAAAATTIALLSLAVYKQYKRTRQRRAVVGVTLAIVFGLLVIGTATRDAPIRRFLMNDPRDLGSDSRVLIWQHSLEAWKQFPVAGSGLGAFREAFRRVQPRELNALVDYAHNDPLQLLVSGGVVGTMLGAIAFIAAFSRMIRRWMRPAEKQDAALCLAVFGALLTISLHGITDFNLSVPANAVTLAIITGLGYAAADAQREERARTPEEGL